MGALFIKSFLQRYSEYTEHVLKWGEGTVAHSAKLTPGGLEVDFGCSLAGGWLKGQCTAVFEQRRETPPPLCWLRPGRCSAVAACLISNSWAAFVALPNFWTLWAAIKILNYLSNLPFNKFIFKCLDWRKITEGTYNSNQKTIFWNSNFFVLFECEQV